MYSPGLLSLFVIAISIAAIQADKYTVTVGLDSNGGHLRGPIQLQGWDSDNHQTGFGRLVISEELTPVQEGSSGNGLNRFILTDVNLMINPTNLQNSVKIELNWNLDEVNSNKAIMIRFVQLTNQSTGNKAMFSTRGPLSITLEPNKWITLNKS